MSDGHDGGTSVVVEKGTVSRGSFATVMFFVLVSAVSVLVLVDQVSSGTASIATFIIFGFFPVLSVPVVAWELATWMPQRFEITPEGARLVVRGKVRRSVAFDSDVRVDALLNSQRLGPKPKAFDSSCAASHGEDDTGGFLILCGITISRGSDTMTISHDDGWRLVDIGQLWKPFLDAAVANDMEMGDRMWRYIEFCDKVGPGLVPEEEDIFTRIREMET